MFVPDPVIKIAVMPKNRSDGDKMSKALQRFRKEDPTFRVMTDEETNEILISGMGELHLEVYIERIRREYDVEIEVGAPKVSYRESPTRAIEFNYKHKKQTGGSGQYAHIVGKLSPLDSISEDSFEFEDHVVGGRLPKQYIPAIEKGSEISWVKARSRNTPSWAPRSISMTARSTKSTRRKKRSTPQPKVASASTSSKPLRSCSNRS